MPWLKKITLPLWFLFISDLDCNLPVKVSFDFFAVQEMEHSSLLGKYISVAYIQLEAGYSIL